MRRMRAYTRGYANDNCETRMLLNGIVMCKNEDMKIHVFGFEYEPPHTFIWRYIRPDSRRTYIGRCWIGKDNMCFDCRGIGYKSIEVTRDGMWLQSHDQVYLLGASYINDAFEKRQI